MSAKYLVFANYGRFVDGHLSTAGPTASVVPRFRFGAPSGRQCTDSTDPVLTLTRARAQSYGHNSWALSVSVY